MEKEQGRFYEEDQEERVVNPQDDDAEQQSEGDAEEVNDMRFFMGLMKLLKQTVEDAPCMMGRALINKETVMNILNNMSQNLPDALQYGFRLFEEQDRLSKRAEELAVNKVSTANYKANKALEKARQDADKIIADAVDEANASLARAEADARRMIENSAVIAQAKDEAAQIISKARKEAQNIRFRELQDTESQLTALQDAVDKMREQLGHSLRVIEDKIDGQ